MQAVRYRSRIVRQSSWKNSLHRLRWSICDEPREVRRNDQMRIPCKTRSQKRARKSNPLRAAKLVARREVPVTDWETLRPLILTKSDGCYLCGRPLTLETMTTDHVTIQPAGCKKNDATENLMPACSYCNSAKGSRRLLPNTSCRCGQKFIVCGLGCLRCKYGRPLTETTVRRTMRTTI